MKVAEKERVWSYLNGWDEVKEGMKNLTENDWALVYHNPQTEGIRISEPLRRDTVYGLPDTEEEVMILTEPIDIANIGVIFALGMFKKVIPCQKVCKDGFLTDEQYKWLCEKRTKSGMTKEEAYKVYGTIKQWSAKTINAFARDLGVDKGCYDLWVDREVAYNRHFGAFTKTGNWLLTYKTNEGYVQVSKKSIKSIANYLFLTFAK